MTDAEVKVFLEQIRSVARQEALNAIKTCVRVVPAYVVSVGTGTATVRLLTSTNSSNDFTASIVTAQTIAQGDYVNVAYWDNLTTAVIFSK